MKKLHHTFDLEDLEKIAETNDFRSAPRDHGIYLEGPTINVCTASGSQNASQIAREDSRLTKHRRD